MDEVRIREKERCSYCGRAVMDGEQIYLFPIGGGSAWVHADCAPACMDAEELPILENPETVPAIAICDDIRFVNKAVSHD